MSTKTFYRHFATRDELLLAVLEEEQALGAREVAKAIEAIQDPVRRLHRCITAFIELPERYASPAVRRRRLREGRRLLALYPDTATQADRPIRRVFLDCIERLAEAGLITADDPELTARSVVHVLAGHIVDAAFQTPPLPPAAIGAHAWRFCAAALGLPPNLIDKAARPDPRSQRPSRSATGSRPIVIQ
jgi:AcrR family transcriptional regulator